jgi:L-iditol 2-dehydrogenase
MRAVRYHGRGELTIEDVPEPVPGDTDVIIAPAEVGLCGTDAHILAGAFPADPPVTLGHEVAGKVVTVGSRVTGLGVGDMVSVDPHRYCRHCRYCRAGSEHLCQDKKGYGVRLDGGMAELLRVPAAVCYQLPEGTPPHIGALGEPASCCLHGMDRLSPRSGLPIIVFGCGPAGLILIRLAALTGLRPVVAADPRAERRRTATRIGADLVLDPADPGFADTAMSQAGGIGYPYIIDAVGSARILEQAIRLAARGASLLVFGVAAPDARAALSPYDIYARELTVLGSCINPYTQERAVGLINQLGAEHWEIARFPLHDVQEAFAAQRSGSYDKVFVTP